VRGMPVIDLASARRAGFVLDAFIDPLDGCIAALDVGGRGEGGHRRLPGPNVRRIGRHAVVVFRPEGLAEPLLDEDRALDIGVLLGLEVLTDTGDRVGFISDVYLDPDTLAVNAYELRTPTIERWLKGPRLILPRQVVLCSRDLMVVPDPQRIAPVPLATEQTQAVTQPRWAGREPAAAVSTPDGATRDVEGRVARSA